MGELSRIPVDLSSLLGRKSVPLSSPKTSYVSEFNNEWHSYEIESLVGHRFRRYGRREPISKYLTRWKGYGPEFDQ
jgi:hypothetical protein